MKKSIIVCSFLFFFSFVSKTAESSSSEKLIQVLTVALSEQGNTNSQLIRLLDEKERQIKAGQPSLAGKIFSWLKTFATHSACLSLGIIASPCIPWERINRERINHHIKMYTDLIVDLLKKLRNQ